MAVVLGAVLALCAATGTPLRLRPVLAGLALVAFVVLARPSPSVLRAALMGAVGLLALATGSRRAPVPALAAAVLVLVLVSPELAAAPGFALSVLATAGLLVLAPPWQRSLARWLPGWLAAALAVPAAAQVACGPVVAALGGGVGLLSVPANLLAVPAVAPATVLGVTAALVAPLCLPLAQLLCWLAYPAVAWLTGVARVGAELPGAALPWPDGLRGALLLAVLILLVLLLLERAGTRRALLVTAGAAASTGCVLLLVLPGWPPRHWQVVMCDVGQGDALAVRTGRDAALVVDAGPDPDVVDRCLRRLGVRAVPLVVLTHPHADHVAGLAGVLRDRVVGGVQVEPSVFVGPHLAAVTDVARAARVPLVEGRVGEERRVGGVTWRVVGPTRPYRGTRSDPNNGSLVLRLEVGGRVLLLAGDVESEAQADLLADPAALRADVLKVPHHGSADQDAAFLAAVRPRLALTSLGAGHSYGHPAPSTLEELSRLGARVLRTDRDGDVALLDRDGVLVAVARGSPLTPPPTRGRR